MVQPRTEKAWSRQHQRAYFAVHRYGRKCGEETLHLDTVRTAEAVIDVRSCWLRRNLVARILMKCGRAWHVWSGRARVLVLEGAQARVSEICCRPKQQDHRHRLSEPAVAPPGHLHDYSRSLEAIRARSAED